MIDLTPVHHSIRTDEHAAWREKNIPTILANACKIREAE